MTGDFGANALTRVDQHVSRRLRGKRRALGMSEDDLAKVIGAECTVIEDYEHARIRVPPEHLTQFSEFLDVPISYFFPATPCPSQ
jgi:transcriptional regulator with XRE-family HTH domain